MYKRHATVTPDAASYAQLGLSGIDEQNLDAMNALVASAGDDGLTIDSVAQLNALANIVDQADGGAQRALTIQDFALLNLTGVDESNLSKIVQIIADSEDDGSGVSTLTKIRHLVDQVVRGLDSEGSDALKKISDGDEAPSEDDYNNIGVAVDPDNLDAMNALVADDDLAIDSVAKLNALANIVDLTDGAAPVTPLSLIHI